MLTVVVIYCENDAKWLKGLVESIHFECEIVLAKTLPSTYWDSGMVNVSGNIRHVEINYPADDFSFAKLRNHAKRFANTEWILSLDADERITLDIEQMQNIMNNERVGGVYMTCLSYVTGEKGEKGSFSQNVVRMFRKEYDWKYRCHEQIAENILEKGKLLADSFGTIIHLGYVENKNILGKAERNIQLLCRDFTENGLDYKRLMLLKGSLELYEEYSNVNKSK